jgi:hypothetical protein
MVPSRQATLTTMAVSVVGQMAQLRPSASMVDTSTVEQVGEGRTMEDVSMTHAMSIVQPGATLPLWMRTEVPKVRRVEEDVSMIAQELW